MTDLERQVLAFVAERCQMFSMLTTRADIAKRVNDVSTPHVINALWDARLIVSSPLRKSKSPIRFQITETGLNALRSAA